MDGWREGEREGERQRVGAREKGGSQGEREGGRGDEGWEAPRLKIPQVRTHANASAAPWRTAPPAAQRTAPLAARSTGWPWCHWIWCLHAKKYQVQSLYFHQIMCSSESKTDEMPNQHDMRLLDYMKKKIGQKSIYQRST